MTKTRLLPSLVLAGLIGFLPPLRSSEAASRPKCAKILGEFGPSGKLRYLSPGGGSNDGRWFADEAGTRWFVKEDAVHPELQTGAEVVTATLYSHLGYTVPETAIVTIDGVRCSASRSLGSNLSLTVLEDADGTDFRQLRIFAAFFKDWDRLQYGPNNFELGRKEFALFDFGGALGARARGEVKPGKSFSPQIGAFENTLSGAQILEGFRVDDLPSTHAWRRVTASDIRSAIARFESLTDLKIDAAVDAAQYSRNTDAKYLKSALKQRRDALIKALAGINALH